MIKFKFARNGDVYTDGKVLLLRECVVGTLEDGMGMGWGWGG